MNPAPTTRARLLVCLRYGIGDLVMELPALRTLRRQCPDAELTVLGAWPALELLHGDTDFDHRAAVQDFGFEHWGDEGSVPARRAFARWLRGRRFDRVLDVAHAATGIQRVLAESSLQGPTTGRDVPPGDRSARAVWHGSIAAWGLDGAVPMPSPRPYIPAAARRRAREFFGARGPDAAVGIAPIASSRLKRWPLERLNTVLGWLVHERSCRLLIFGLEPGGQREAAERELLARGLPSERVEHVPRTHLQDTAALMARCRAFLSNDTGLMHLAAAVRTPTVGLFGPTSASVYLPEHAVAVTGERPCGYRLVDRFGPPDCVLADTCLAGGPPCIESVPVAQTIQALTRLLARNGCDDPAGA